MDSDLLIALLGDISAKLDTTNGLLRDIESNTSSTDTNTSYTWNVKSELEDIHSTIKEINNID